MVNLEIGLDPVTLLIGVIVFLARVADVSMGTMRTISIVQGRTKIAFILGFFEVSMWLVVISAVVNQIISKPILGVFYALGFSTGNVVGIIIERRLAFGNMALRIITPGNGEEMTEKIRGAGFAVTTFRGEGLLGPVTLLYVVCRRKDLNDVVGIARKIQPDIFYTTEQECSVSRIYRSCVQDQTPWSAIVKKK